MAEKPPVNLTSLATLKFRPDEARYDDWKGMSASWDPEFLLTVRPDGTPKRCEIIAANIPDDLGTRLCTDLLTNAKVEIWEGYSLGGRDGIVAVNKQPMTQLQGIPIAGGKTASPFAFALNDLGSTEYLDFEPLSADELQGVRDDPTKLKAPPYIPAYPRAALREKLEGSSRMLLSVGMDGSVQSCRIFETSGTILLDAAACKYALKVLEFEPMEGVDPADAPFHHAIPITWRLKK
ncbi:energy transducer TonB [Erythrobacter sp. THAF29]|uniref:energy transducer TonB n=1 Tax=Erythrobacter sp. THAF29 TaxID=2587851 RepID=UPI001562D96B|nr:energy transducer TonB [Erythrobacter sp. THAF29]